MAYAITASLRETTLIIGVADAAAALDKVGELMLSGFHIDAVSNEDWHEMSPTDLSDIAMQQGPGVHSNRPADASRKSSAGRLPPRAPTRRDGGDHHSHPRRR